MAQEGISYRLSIFISPSRQHKHYNKKHNTPNSKSTSGRLCFGDDPEFPTLWCILDHTGFLAIRRQSINSRHKCVRQMEASFPVEVWEFWSLLALWLSTVQIVQN